MIHHLHLRLAALRRLPIIAQAWSCWGEYPLQRSSLRMWNRYLNARPRVNCPRLTMAWHAPFIAGETKHVIKMLLRRRVKQRKTASLKQKCSLLNITGMESEPRSPLNLLTDEL